MNIIEAVNEAQNDIPMRCAHWDKNYKLIIKNGFVEVVDIRCPDKQLFLHTSDIKATDWVSYKIPLADRVHKMNDIPVVKVEDVIKTTEKLRKRLINEVSNSIEEANAIVKILEEEFGKDLR